MAKEKIAILGAGPIGLEAALYASQLGYEVEIFEQGEVGANILDWGHVRLFSPFSMNHSSLGVSRVKDDLPSWQEPDPQAYLTGREFVDSYLVPLSQLSELKKKINAGMKVVSIGRENILKGELIGDPARPTYPFRILTENIHGEEQVHTADCVIDSTGIYNNPNWLGEGGIPALGELNSKPFIDYQMPDVYGKDRSKFAGKKSLVIGAGYSAATVVCDFQNLIREEPATSLIWAIRDKRSEPIPAIEDDPLPSRAGLTNQANSISQDTAENIQFRNNTTVDSIHYSENKDAFSVGLKSDGHVEKVEVNRVIATVGYGPDNSIYRELQVHECYASRGPMKLAAALLGASSTDCLAQESAGADTLKNPEPNFFIIGNKSYGRNPTFLIRIGLSQIVEVFSLISRNEKLNLYQTESEGASLKVPDSALKITVPEVPTYKPAFDEIPLAPLYRLDTLWFQVGGTICNLWCTHCFISCSPENHKFGFMPREEVKKYLEESKQIGVKEYYFTGGEPFMNRDMLGILEDTLAIGPATVLTNGILIQDRVARRLKEITGNSIYSLEIRVSIDGFTEETNDKIRGKGSFRKAMAGVKKLVENGFLPIITVAQTWEDSETETILNGFKKTMNNIGYTRPRIKMIPPLRIGREKIRSHGYDKYEYLTKEIMVDYDDHLLQCTASRMVTDKGIYVCPILIDYPEAKVSETLAESFEPYPLKHQACYTCYISGAICHNFSASEN